MKLYIALLFFASATSNITCAYAACNPVPPSWKLFEPVDPSILGTPKVFRSNAYYGNAVTAMLSELKPGDKLTPYSNIHITAGMLGGGSGYALIRLGCLIKSASDTRI